jgi:hypothetical protein
MLCVAGKNLCVLHSTFLIWHHLPLDSGSAALSVNTAVAHCRLLLSLPFAKDD